ncbi:LolA family protein [Enterovirga aerilata]|uniref:Outer membrane lipoprotein carrier protein LolA n=1 Tax=Enterovirga aerilata TaxID=2730920 RepID=A0A849I4S2_9HYPH|nr:outer-membrane lipoprotein carrier protein LolA [Enterovirga sp. DB1703]NNM71120.1 outer membrane lipoprotein carrier protein LolA [Enterovirga sp. DB1703]
MTAAYFTRAPALALAALLALGPSAEAAGRSRVAGVLPPPRPASLGRDLDVAATGSIVPIAKARAAGAPVVPAAASDKLTDRQIVEKANAALNSVTSMVADFTQVGGDGRRLTGILYLQRPGKLRFEYEKPSTLEVVSDGSTVLVRDRKLNTSDPYPISQTPLKFLLSSKIDLSRDARVTAVATDQEGVRISIEDSSTLGGTSKITLYFDPEITTLKRWRVIDPQGYTTTVSLSDIEKNRTIDPRIFMLNYMRPVE